MMKVNKILVLGMLVTSIFASCSNEDTAENGSKGLVNGDAYITLSVSGSGIQGSRTTGDKHQDATPDESKINNLALYLVDHISKTVVFSTDVAAEQLISNTATNPTYTTTPIPVTGVGTGVILDTPYDVYVVANKTVSDVAIAKGDNWDAAKVLKATNSDASDFYKSATGGNFAMFNEANTPGVDANGKVTITSTNDSKSNPAKVNANGTTVKPINLDRLTAKIQAQDGSASASSSNLDISGITVKQASFISGISMVGYVILNGGQSTYLQQTWSGTPAPYVLNTPSSNTFYGLFTDYATVTPGTTAGTYIKIMDNTSDDQFTKTKDPVYCLENNTEVENSKDKVTNTTGLILKYQVTVNSSDGLGSDGLAGSNCFYGYNGQYFATLDAIQATYPNVFGTGVAATDLQNAKDLLKNGTGNATEKSISDFRVKYNIEVFRNGIMYYTYFIKDQNYTDPKITTPDADKHIYAVLRNTVYDLHVASLLRIGNDIPGGWNPGDQNTTVDQKDYYMQVQVSVNPWVLSSTDIDLQ